MTSLRMPLSVREGAASEPALREGVPDFAEEELRRWIFKTASLDPDEARHVLIRLGLPLPMSYRRRYAQELEEMRVEQARLDAEWQAKKDAQAMTDSTVRTWYPELGRQFAPSPATPSVRFLAEGTDTSILWDVVDDLLHAFCVEPLPPDTSVFAIAKRSDAKRTMQVIQQLRRLLEESRSVYEIRPDQRGLRRRIDAVLADSVRRSADQAAAAGYLRAGEHIIKARDKLFALLPDPGGAYAEMILAVEEVACPQFLPNDPVPTLGKVRAHLRDASTRYEYILAGNDQAGSIDGVVAMLTDLCGGQRNRHGGGPNSAPVSQQAAEIAFTLALCLITVFASRGVRPRTACHP